MGPQAMGQDRMGLRSWAIRSLVPAKWLRRRLLYRQLQREAAARPESTPVATPEGEVWMSPIEVKLYEAMRREGLSPLPQHPVHGYFVDFAFPDRRVAVEADGAAYHGSDRRRRDRKRDWILRKHGWKVLRFRGTTIHDRAENCVYVIKKELAARPPTFWSRFFR